MADARDAAKGHVWLVVGDCGDYYCEGNHVLAVATTEAEAVRIRTEAEAATWTNRYGSSGKRWAEVGIETLPVDELRADARSHTYA